MILFRNALLSSGKIQDIFIADGVIKEISSSITTPAQKIIDCEGRLLLSGMIDCHVHFRDPGFPQKEDAESGSKAALRGGVTSFLDMPNTLPPCITSEALAQKKSIYRQNSYANYGFHFGADAKNNSNIVRTTSGFAALKIFLNESTGHMLVTDDHILDKLFQSTRYIAVHAEGDAVDKALYFSKKHSNILYLCHISKEEELSFIKKAKDQKQQVFAEVCPHHVLFNDSHETDLLTMKPHLRTKRDQQKMLEALDSGLIDTWGTDHAPHLISEKKQLTYGIPAIEFALELLLSLGKEMSWSYKKIEELYSSSPQKIFQILGKGHIAQNFDADFVLIEPDTSYTIQESDITSKCGWSPYLNRKLSSKIHSTYIGGECVYDSNTKNFKKSNYIKELDYVR